MTKRTQLTTDPMGLPVSGMEGGQPHRAGQHLEPVLTEILPTITYGTRQDNTDTWAGAVRSLALNCSVSVCDRVAFGEDRDALGKAFMDRHVRSIRAAMRRAFKKDNALRLREYKIYRHRSEYPDGSIAVAVCLERTH